MTEMRYSERWIPDGDEGTRVTVEDMIEMTQTAMSDAHLRVLARSLRRNSDVETAKAIFRYVCSFIEYKSDPHDKELLISPRHTLSARRPYGDCDDLSMAAAVLYLLNGLETRFRTIEWKNDKHGKPIPYYSHVYPVVCLPSIRKCLPTDPVLGFAGFGNEQGSIRRRKDYPITIPQNTMGTLARLDDNGLRGTLADCKPKRKKPVHLNIINNINAGNTSNATRTSSPETATYSPEMVQNNPRSSAATMHTPRTRTTTAIQNNPRSRNSSAIQGRHSGNSGYGYLPYDEETLQYVIERARKNNNSLIILPVPVAQAEASREFDAPPLVVPVQSAQPTLPVEQASFVPTPPPRRRPQTEMKQTRDYAPEFF